MIVAVGRVDTPLGAGGKSRLIYDQILFFVAATIVAVGRVDTPLGAGGRGAPCNIAWCVHFLGGGACTTLLFFKGGSYDCGMARAPRNQNLRIVELRARVLDSVWGVGWGERGRVAPKLAGFQLRHHAHPVQSCNFMVKIGDTRGLLTPSSSRGN